MKKPKIPRVPAAPPHDPRDCTVCQANAKQPAARRKEPQSGPEGKYSRRRRQHPEGFTSERTAIEPTFRHTGGKAGELYAPTGKHRGRATATDTGHTGKHRAYEGRHRRGD